MKARIVFFTFLSVLVLRCGTGGTVETVIPEAGHDELGRLSQTLEAMREKIRKVLRGEAVPERITSVRALWERGVLNPESNLQFGEGGAGTWSSRCTRPPSPRTATSVCAVPRACGTREGLGYAR